MDYQKLNKTLKNFNFGKQVQQDGEGGEYESYFTIHEFEPDVFIRVEHYEDSYGSESIRGIEFVQPTSKVKVVYEPIV
jgi:hypothetical protein